jgi:transcriptional regulator with XRE-family HTH domain
MPDSRVADLLQRYGVGTPRLSVRSAAGRCAVSPQTMSKVMLGKVTRLRSGTLDKISRGLGVPRELLERASLADAGFLQVEGGSDLAEALEHIQGLSAQDLATIQVEIGRMQQRRAAEQEMRDAAGSAE